MMGLRLMRPREDRNPAFRSLLRSSRLSRSALAILPIVCLLSLPFSACGPGASWSEALEGTAPPDPEDSAVGSAAEGSTQAAGSARGSGSTARPPEPESAREPDGEGPVSGAGAGATLEVVLAGDLDCFAGAVRCYVDGRYVGLVGDDGRFEIPVRPGDHLLVVWDSRGRWQAQFTADTGGVVRIPIRCDDRPDQGAY